MASSKYVQWMMISVLVMSCGGECKDASKPAVAAAEAEAPAPDSAVEAPEAESDPAPEAKSPSEPEAVAAQSPAQARLHEARRVMFQTPPEGYRLAKESYELEPTPDALWVMGPAACRMKDRAKAQWVHERLAEKDRPKLVDLCKNKGVDLGVGPT